MKKVISLAIFVVMAASIALAAVTLPTTLTGLKKVDNAPQVQYTLVMTLSRSCQGCPATESVTPLSVNPVTGALLVNTDIPGGTFWTESNSVAVLSIGTQDALSNSLYNAAVLSISTQNALSNSLYNAAVLSIGTQNALSNSLYNAAMLNILTESALSNSLFDASLPVRLLPCATCYIGSVFK